MSSRNSPSMIDARHISSRSHGCPSTSHELAVSVPEDDYQISALALESSLELIITSTSGVHRWNQQTIDEIFKSGSEGIVAAKTTNGKILAVADSHLVILHDISKGMKESYRLKSKQGRVQMLHFEPRTERLFFTTTLQHAVQSYSISRGELLDPGPSHGSPVSVFALSKLDVLLSASQNPPEILVSNLRVNRPPTLLQPHCSTSPAVAATFHIARPNILALAFADGSIGIYDVFRLQTKGPLRGIREASGAFKGELAHTVKLHTLTIESYGQDEDKRSPTDTKINTELVLDARGGINAIAFVPGHSCTLVSVASDGRCCVVSFDKYIGKSHAIEPLRHWYVGAAATSLSVFCRDLREERESGKESHRSLDMGDVTIAIGRGDGKMMLYNGYGDLIVRRQVSSGKILSIDRAELQLDIIPTLQHTQKHQHEQNRPKVAISAADNSRQSHERAQGMETEISVDERNYPQFTRSGSGKVFFPSQEAHHEEQTPAKDTATPTQGCQVIADEILDAPSAQHHHDTKQEHSEREARKSSRYTHTKKTSSSKTSKAKHPPAIPPRPTPKREGRWARKRAETADVHGNQPDDGHDTQLRGKSKTWDEKGRPVKLPEDGPFAADDLHEHKSESISVASPLAEPKARGHALRSLQQGQAQKSPRWGVYYQSHSSTDSQNGYDIEWTPSTTHAAYEHIGRVPTEKSQADDHTKSAHSHATHGGAVEKNRKADFTKKSGYSHDRAPIGKNRTANLSGRSTVDHAPKESVQSFVTAPERQSVKVSSSSTSSGMILDWTASAVSPIKLDTTDKRLSSHQMNSDTKSRKPRAVSNPKALATGAIGTQRMQHDAGEGFEAVDSLERVVKPTATGHDQAGSDYEPATSENSDETLRATRTERELLGAAHVTGQEERHVNHSGTTGQQTRHESHTRRQSNTYSKHSHPYSHHCAEVKSQLEDMRKEIASVRTLFRDGMVRLKADILQQLSERD